MTTEPSTQRTFNRQRIWRVTPRAYDRAVRLLVDAARQLGDVQAVTGIANGGVTLAHGVATLLHAAEYQIGARHNPTNDVYTQATGQVEVDMTTLTTALGGRRIVGRVLLVDDICGTGATFAATRAALQQFLHPEATVSTLALCRNEGTSCDPDLWAWTVDDWVLFPWEPTPSCSTLIEDIPLPNGVNGR